MSKTHVMYSPSPWVGPTDCPLCFLGEVQRMHAKKVRVPLLNFARQIASDRTRVDGAASQNALHLSLFLAYKETLRDALHSIVDHEGHLKHGATWVDNITCEREALVDHLHGHVQRVSFHTISPPPTPRMVACEPPSACTLQ